jgi:hypothetical protein
MQFNFDTLEFLIGIGDFSMKLVFLFCHYMVSRVRIIHVKFNYG